MTTRDPAGRGDEAPDSEALGCGALGGDATREIDDTTVSRSEERVNVGVEETAVGRVRARKRVDTEHVQEPVTRGVERAEMEREPAIEGDPGEVQTLPDGSVSIPVFEEVLVVEKRLVVRERVIIRKHTVYEEQVVEADLRREQLEIDVDDAVRERVTEG